MFQQVGIALLVAPWVVLVSLVRTLAALVRLPRRFSAGVASTVVCPVGHANDVMGRWTCSCGATYLGHAFAPCPVCSMPAGWTRCAQCGLAIRAP